jgi:hypothetical protein
MDERGKKERRVMKVRKLYLATLLTCTFIFLPMLSMPSARALKYVPFKATGAGSAVPISFIPPSTLEIYITGTGKANHLGAIKIVQNAFVDTNTLEFTGTYVLTGANGDTIYGGFHGYFVSTSTGLQINGKFTIDGGTGELAHATGYGTCTGMQTGTTFSYTLAGKISYE